MVNAVAVNQLTVAYNQKVVLNQLTFQIPQGTLVGIIGPNGAGKSTFLKSILGLVPRLTGEIQILGESIKKMKNHVCYIPQRETVDWDFPINVHDLVMMGCYGRLGWFKRPGITERKLALKCLEEVGMEDYSSRHISQLSGGQQQRIFLARALMQQTDLYFMDEPFTGVDAVTEKSIIELLQNLKNQGKTVLVVHHDLSTVKDYFDWTILLNKEMIACGPTEQVFHHANLQKTYGGKISFISQDMIDDTHHQSR